MGEGGANLWGINAGVIQSAVTMEMYCLCQYRKKNIFEEKRTCIHLIEDEIQKQGRESINLSIADTWQEAANDDDINEP